MPFRKWRAYVDLMRPLNVGITLISIPAASVLAGATASQWLQVLIAALTGGLVAAAANSINDYFDVEIDKINKPGRPIPRGDATQREAWILWLSLSAVALVLNTLLPTAALVIVVLSIILLYWYSAFFKRTVMMGNLVVGLMTGMAFIYGAIVVARLDRAYMPALFAFLINVVREIIKDVEDIEGDRKERAVTLPVKYGVRPALWLSSALLAILISTTIAAYVLNIYGVWYLVLVAVVDVILVAVIVLQWRDQSVATMSRLSNALKLCMLLGLLAIYFGSR